MTLKIEVGAVADCLNRGERRVNRHGAQNDDIAYVHVSSLIQTSAAYKFCPREQVLRYMERAEAAGETVPPKYELLFETGHFIGENLVKKFIIRSHRYGHLVWGDWTCACKQTVVRLSYKPEGAICNHCNQPISDYKEIDLIDEDAHISGHPDLLLRQEDGLIIVYEAKSIDRADVNFDTMQEPLGDHVLQGSFYYWMLRKKGYNVHKGVRVIYIDRSLSQIYTTKPYKEFEAMRVSAERVALLVNKSKSVKNGARKGILPGRICEKVNDSRANQCSRQISCWYRTKKLITRLPPKDGQ